MSSDHQRENEELLQFLYACPVGLAGMAADGTIGMMNPLAMQLLMPISKAPFVFNFLRLIESYAPDVTALLQQFEPNHGVVCQDYRIFLTPSRAEDSFDPKVLSCTVVKLSADRFMLAMCDVSRQVAQELRLKQAEVWFASLLDGVNDFAVVSLDAEGRIDSVNPSFLRQTGFSQAEAIGKTLDMFGLLASGQASLSMPDQIAAAARHGWHLSEGWQHRRSGIPYWCQRLVAVRSEGEPGSEPVISGYTVILREVERQTFDTGKLTKMLTLDHLTGACNRARFFEVAEREHSRFARYGEPLALVAIDVDHFKRVNDTYGHGVGDMVLTALARTAISLLRPSDTFARIGGEEFVALLPSTDMRNAGLFAERLRVALAAATITVGDVQVSVTASFGCADTKVQGGTFAELLSAADAALYEAKRAGRDRVVLASPSWAVI